MAYLPGRANVNSLFGTYTVARNTGIITPDDVDVYGNSTLDYIMRGKDGLQKKIINSNKTIEAITNPTTHLDQKAADLQTNVLDKINADFDRIYKNEIKRGLSLEKTKKNTVEEVDRLLTKYLRYHEENFPIDLTKRVVKKLVG
jgi:iron-sulfur cluster repair protein YtfE (RIC family)